MEHYVDEDYVKFGLRREEAIRYPLSKVKPEEVKWLFYPYIPRGKISLLMGDPGCGKTTLTAMLSAAVTNGLKFPEMTPDPEVEYGNFVLYQNAEDGLADTIRPRMDKNETDVQKVLIIDESEAPIDLSEVSQRLEYHICEFQYGLVIFDPVQAYLGSSVDMHRANEIRPIMTRLAKLAQKYNVAILLVCHMNKQMGQKLLYKALGSIDLMAAVRSAMVLAKDVNNPDNRVLIHVKSSLAREAEPVAFQFQDDGTMKYIGPYECDFDTLLDKNPVAPKLPKQVEEAMQFLSAYLMNEPVVLASKIIDEGEGAGFTQRTLHRAKDRMGVTAFKRDGAWYWSYPLAKKAPASTEQDDKMTR